jgi:hypothetical protein
VNVSWSPALAEEAARVLGPGTWRASSLGGSSGRTFVVEGPRRVVVRACPDPDVIERLAALEVVPPVLATGTSPSTFVIQPFIDGETATPDWIDEHVDDVGRCLGRYLTDRELGRRVGRTLVASEFGARLSDDARVLLPRGLARLAATLPRTAHDIAGGPSHGDPNGSNFLRGDRLWLVDWDDVAIADPVRDLGQIAWWYVAERRWDRLFAAAGLGLTGDVRRRIHWWAAAESLDVALRLLRSDAVAAAPFLEDFEAAARGQPNPRR